MVRGRVKKLFITSMMIILSLFIYSTPASAYDLVSIISPTGRSWEWGSGSYWYETQLNGNGEYNWATTNDAIYWGRFMNNDRTDNSWILKGVTTGNNIDFKEGHYYKTNLQITIQGYNYNNTNFGVQIPQINRIMFPANTPYELISVKPVETECLDQISGNLGVQNPTVPSSISAQISCFRGSIKYEFIVKATRNDTGKLILGNNSAWMLQSYVGIAKGWNLGFVFPEIIEEYKLSDDVSYYEQQKAEDNAKGEQGQTDSNSSGQQVEGATTSLLNVVSGFFGAFMNASATNCNFNMGIILETVDMCSAYIPPTYNVILSIVSLLFVVPMVIWLINSILNAFKEFQE